MLLGFAVTEHCNLRCSHCIRDDVTTVRSLEVDLIESVVSQGVALYGSVVASLTGGEPLLHPEFRRIVEIFAERSIPYRFVSNGWHLKRILPLLERYPPQAVRLSLSGATEEVHDAERGKGSFRRVLMSVALLASRQIPAYLSIVIDRRDRHQLREAADLAESLGCLGINFILPQPTPGSAARDSDLPPQDWWPAARTSQLTNRMETDAQPAWLPDGRVVYTSWENGQARLRWLDPSQPDLVNDIDVGAGTPGHPFGAL